MKLKERHHQAIPLPRGPGQRSVGLLHYQGPGPDKDFTSEFQIFTPCSSTVNAQL